MGVFAMPVFAGFSVIQYFAHIMISGMRGLGLPAAYVSGYLRTAQSAGEDRLEGAGAMHAWVLVGCGEDVGWCGLDPTNGIFAGDDHVVLAIGRDYADVAPIDGVIFASGGQRPRMSVNVAPGGEGGAEERTAVAANQRAAPAR